MIGTKTGEKPPGPGIAVSRNRSTLAIATSKPMAARTLAFTACPCTSISKAPRAISNNNMVKNAVPPIGSALAAPVPKGSTSLTTLRNSGYVKATRPAIVARI